MDYQPTWEDAEIEPTLLERGPRDETMEEQKPTPFRVVIDGEVVEVEAEDAYDAIKKAQKAHKAKERKK